MLAKLLHNVVEDTGEYSILHVALWKRCSYLILYKNDNWSRWHPTHPSVYSQVKAAALISVCLSVHKIFLHFLQLYRTERIYSPALDVLQKKGSFFYTRFWPLRNRIIILYLLQQNFKQFCPAIEGTDGTDKESTLPTRILPIVAEFSQYTNVFSLSMLAEREAHHTESYSFYLLCYNRYLQRVNSCSV